MSELIDLVDPNGAIVQSSVPRDDAAEYEGLHMQIVIAVIQNKAGKFLVHKRSMQKRVNPGDIDHVCGGMYSGETPEAAVVREAREEGGVSIGNSKIIHASVNEYNRYRYLIAATSNDTPDPTFLDPAEVEWAAFYSLEELEQKRDSGEFTFVDGFFEDIFLALDV